MSSPDSSTITLFFSLPFRPVGRTNAFCSGHVALGIGGTVYQVYNPNLLGLDFLFSVMPTENWLYGPGGKWVDREPTSPSYRHVYLYGCSESSRTVVYCAQIGAKQDRVDLLRQRIYEVDEDFRQGILSYRLLVMNCSSIIANLLGDACIITPRFMDHVPAFLFKHFVLGAAGCGRVRVSTVASFDASAFALHGFCVGVPGLNPRRRMDQWVSAATRSGVLGSVTS